MEKKTLSIILIIVSVLCCGCPGISLCITSVGTLAGLGTYEVTLPGMATEDQIPPAYGLVFLCLAVLMILVPVVVGVVAWRQNKNTTTPDVSASNDSLPPAM